ncbi:hypothetical protein KJA15_03535 [Patescibacteria group bacterium]|nr:hypothetical protein [Patescibacteria group bacterium]
MPLIKIKKDIIPVVSTFLKDDFENVSKNKFNSRHVEVKFGPIAFQQTKDLKPVGEPLYITKPIFLEVPFSFFHKKNDNIFRGPKLNEKLELYTHKEILEGFFTRDNRYLKNTQERSIIISFSDVVRA